MQRVVIIGPGAIGCAFAAALIEAGHAVSFAARTPFEQLQVTHPGGEVRADAAMATPLDVAEADIVVLATKAHQISSAAAWLQAVRPPAIVAVLQNGLDHEDRVRPLLAEGSAVVPAMVACPADRLAPGRVDVRGNAHLDVPGSEPGRAFAEAFAGSFAVVRPVDDFQTSLWRKLMLNAIGGGIGTIARRSNQLFIGDQEALALARALGVELLAVARADGADLSEADVDRLLTGLAKGSAHLPSIVADRIAGQPTEWRERNRIVVERAERHGLAVPLHRMLTTLLRLGEPGTAS